MTLSFHSLTRAQELVDSEHARQRRAMDAYLETLERDEMEHEEGKKSRSSAPSEVASHTSCRDYSIV